MRAAIVLALSVALGAGPLAVGAERGRLPRTRGIATAFAVGAQNVPVDTDGDGAPDQALVTDWDDDGTLEIEDVQAAVDALTDTGDKSVTIGPGQFVAPASITRPGLVTLPSNIVLEGSGPQLTTLIGFLPTDLTSVEPVVTNWAGASNVTVRQLAIDGGWAGGNATGFPHARMGLLFDACTDCRAEFLAVHHTLHTCLYARNGEGIRFENNELSDCGNYGGAGSTYPCVYLFAKDGVTQHDVWVTDNTCVRSGSNALNMRADDAVSGFDGLHFARNVVSDTAVVAGRAQYCLIVSRATNSTFVDTTCTRTGSAVVQAAAFGDVSGLLIDGLTLANLGPKGYGLQVLGHVENATFRNITVDGTPSDRECLIYDNPLRNVVFENLELSNCGRQGISEFQENGTGPGENDGLTFRHVTISHVDTDRQDGVDWSGIDFLGPARGLFMEDVTIEDATLDGVLFSDGFELSTVRGLTVRDVGRHGLLFEDASSYVTLENVEIDDTGSHGIFVGSGVHRHVVLRDSVVRNAAGHGLTSSNDALFEDLRLLGNTIESAAFKGIDLSLATPTPSTGLTLAGNLLDGFGLGAPASGNAIGIDVSGTIQGLLVAQNTLIDGGGQALLGIRHQPSPAPPDPSYLCSNACGGALTASNCLQAGIDPAYQSDGDLDGRADACDNCPAVANPDGVDLDGDGLGDACDGDDDGDGEPDGGDACPLDALNDADGDALCADTDNCPDLANPAQVDLDADGTGDGCDNCPTLSNPDRADHDGDGEGDVCDDDDDDDGVLDGADPCPFDDLNDADGDDVCASVDNCPETTNAWQLDRDLDGAGDVCDTCPTVSDPAQLDADGDGIGEACDACPDDTTNDPDGDGLCASVDVCPFVADPDQDDQDGDGVGDACDSCLLDPDDDVDQDGVCGDVDNCPGASNANQADSDADGVGTVCDNCPAIKNAAQEDGDADAVGDACDNCPQEANGTQADLDADRVGDACDNCPGHHNSGQSDLDTDDEGDVCDLDDGAIHVFHPSRDLIDWQDEVGYDTWNLYLGSLSVLKATRIYTQATAPHYCGLTLSQATDTTPVSPGNTLFSLVTGEAGGVESGLGDDSAGVPRPNTSPCP